MRGTLLYFNGLLTLFFVGFLVYTLWAREHIEVAAHDYVVTKTVVYAEPLVATAEGFLSQKFVKAALSGDQVAMIRAELAKFRAAPRTYLEALVGRGKHKVAQQAGVLEKLTGWQRPVVDYYERTLARALLHVRIFAVTNLVAAVLALVIAYVSRDRVHGEQLILSAVLFAAVIVSSLQFFDESTYFDILLNRASTFGYPVALIGMFIWLYHELGPALRKVVEIDAEIVHGRNPAEPRT